MLSPGRLEYFEKILITLRRRILKDIWFEEETIGVQQRDAAGGGNAYGVHMMAEQATEVETREVAAFLATVDAAVLEDIDIALRKIIHKKDYGICEDCHQQISERRLRALPYARLCKKCQSAREHV